MVKIMWINSPFYKYATAVILVLLIFLLLPYAGSFISPIFELISAVLLPLILTTVLYYLLRPVVHWITQKKVPRTAAILIVYCLLLILILLFSSFVTPIIGEQIDVLSKVSSSALDVIKTRTVQFAQLLPFNISVEEAKGIIATYLYQVNEVITNNIVAVATWVTHVTISLIFIPFILFYFLRDDRQLYVKTITLAPHSFRTNTKTILGAIDDTLSTYVIGQLIVSSILGFLLLIGYWVIGLKSAVILALFAMVAVTIPFFGIFIAMIPAIIVGLAQDPWMALKVIGIVLGAHALEGNFVSPQILSYRLHLHPLTVMLILLASGSLYGVAGLFLATPIYAVLKVVVQNLYDMYYPQEKEEKV